MMAGAGARRHLPPDHSSMSQWVQAPNGHMREPGSRAVHSSWPRPVASHERAGAGRAASGSWPGVEGRLSDGRGWTYPPGTHVSEREATARHEQQLPTEERHQRFTQQARRLSAYSYRSVPAHLLLFTRMANVALGLSLLAAKDTEPSVRAEGRMCRSVCGRLTDAFPHCVRCRMNRRYKSKPYPSLPRRYPPAPHLRHVYGYSLRVSLCACAHTVPGRDSGSSMAA